MGTVPAGGATRTGSHSTPPVFTTGPGGVPHVNPVWSLWDGEHLRFTTSSARRKYKNVVADPRLSISVNDPDSPYRYLEVRAEVVAVEPDPTGAFFDVLARRYGLEYEAPIGDAPQRVVIVARPVHTTSQ